MHKINIFILMIVKLENLHKMQHFLKIYNKQMYDIKTKSCDMYWKSGFKMKLFSVLKQNQHIKPI